jgi:CRISPR-associated protein Csb2
VVLGLSGPVDLRSLPAPLGESLAGIIPAGGSRFWHSLTPLVLPRFAKRSGRNTVKGQVASELDSRDLPPAEIHPLDSAEASSRCFRHFIRVRGRGGPPPPRETPLSVRLAFAEPVSGPLALGYASHFGLGLFTAVAGEESLIAGAPRTGA